MRPAPLPPASFGFIRGNDPTNGLYIFNSIIPGRRRVKIKVIVSDDQDWPFPLPAWDHVSVSTDSGCPIWEEMAWVKTLFFKPTETVIQLHPPDSEYVNCHPHTLHLWRPVGVEIPLPPSDAVGPKSAKTY